MNVQELRQLLTQLSSFLMNIDLSLTISSQRIKTFYIYECMKSLGKSTNFWKNGYLEHVFQLIRAEYELG